MTKQKRVMSPVAWFGGKSRMVKKLVPMIPAHTTYVEPFGGAASMLLAKMPSPIEVYNDLNSGIVNFFKVLRDKASLSELTRLATLTPYSRQEFLECRENWDKEKNPVSRAHQWFVVARMSFAGLFADGGWSYSRTSTSRGIAQVVSAWLGAIERLPEVCERLLTVMIENKNALDLIETFDGPDTFFYLDPPYVHSTRKAGRYQCEMTDEDHEALIDSILKVEGKVMLSGYANPIYKKLEDAGWRREDFTTKLIASGHTRKSKAKTRSDRVESVWMNYDGQEK